ncbi:MAG TPA: DUF5985 family protein [Polyangiaceae bacterium]|nr:DUF5985 family protein [Polyangiaceae bacterium]
MILFIWGALTMASLVVAAFMFRFWRQTRDRLFAMFGAAFSALSINWAVLAFAQPSQESRHYVYLIRLASFGLILAGIIDRNRNPMR